MNKRPPLFVLDLNGTLLERLTHSDEKAAFRRNPHYNSYPEPKYDYTINSFPVVCRPHLAEFLECVFRAGRVAVWSSMNAVNTSAFCRAIIPPHLFPALRFTWSQAQCECVLPAAICASPAPSYTKPLWRKPLDKIWNEFPGEFDALNTIMVDDSSAKLELHVANHLHVPEFQLAEGDYRSDRVLMELARRINRLDRDSCIEDYRLAIPGLAEGLLPFSCVAALKR